jgi:PAS domain S-box-containing protein
MAGESADEYEELERLRIVTEAAPALLAFVDADLRYRFVNQTYAEWTGKPREVFLGRTQREVLSDGVFEEIRSCAEAALTSGETSHCSTTIPADWNGTGSPLRHVDVTYVPHRKTPDDPVSGLVVHVADVTERKRTEDRLRLATRSARCLLWYAKVSETGHPWLKWDLRLYDEEGAQNFFPLDIDLPDVPYTFAWYRSRLGEDRERMEQYGREQVRAGKSYTQEFRCRGRDGAIRWFKEDVEVETLYPGLWWVVGVCTDITELRAAQEALREAAERQRDFLREVLFSVSEGKLRLCSDPADLPAPLPEAAPPVVLRPETLIDLRRIVGKVAGAQGFVAERGYDLIAAVGEASMNAVVHAGGGTGRVCVADGRVQVWIEDGGDGIAVDALHRATLERGYTTAGSLGHGFWIMLRTVDQVWLLTHSEGTTVVIEQDAVKREEGWPAFQPPLSR